MLNTKRGGLGTPWWKTRGVSPASPPAAGKGEGLGRLWEEGSSFSSSCVAPSLAEVPEAREHMLLPWMLEEGCPGRASLLCFPLLVPCAHLQHFRVFLAVGNAWEEEGAAPGSLRAQCESSATSAHPKYPSIPQDNPESPHGKPQNSPGCDTAHIPSAQAAQGCALLKSAVACLVS